jgi:radical SAM protein with 4Fe4S-binding SPASM domain
MDVDKFEMFIKKLGVFRFLINNVGLTGKGEPLLHPDFLKFCDVMNKYKVKFSVTTNGDFIEGYMDALSKYKYLRQLRISVYSNRDWQRLKGIPSAYENMDIGFYNMTGKPIPGTEDGIKLWAEGLDGQNTVPKDFNKIEICTKPFTYLSLNPDGTIVFCNAYYEIGTWNDNILRILNSKKSRRFRKLALKLKDVPKADCLNCAFNHYEKNL